MSRSGQDTICPRNSARRSCACERLRKALACTGTIRHFEHIMERRDFLHLLGWAGLGGSLASNEVLAEPERSHVADDRRYWVDILDRLAGPVLTALADGQLKQRMPVEVSPNGNARDRSQYAHLEAFGRLLAGISPWLELGSDSSDEEQLRSRYAELARKGLTMATDPASPDFMNFNRGGQPLVDAAFLAHALLRAPAELWEKTDAATRENIVRALESTRAIVPAYSNWLLFTAMVEAALMRFGAEGDRVRINLALRKMDEWYKGDGVYGDGQEFHFDYYNSYVIQPFLLDILGVVRPGSDFYTEMYERVRRVSRRYAAIQERLIAPDGTFPVIGRSIAYRAGAFQLLAQMALRGELPEGVSPGQVRGALSAVLRRTMEPEGTFDDAGWLQIGLSGRQPDLAETYICTGSLYLCATALLPLGLSPENPFWSAPAENWTSKRIWAGENARADKSLTLS